MSQVATKLAADFNARLKTAQEKKNKTAEEIKAEREARAKARQEKLDAAKKFAGGMIHAATGMMVPGTGGMDSVPILAAPGEFVMRRAAVDKYGPAMMKAMNIGSYQVPKYNLPPKPGKPSFGIRPPKQRPSAPVYNGYNVNVNVAQTNANPDEIANRTIMKIKEMQNVNIRSARG